MIRTTPRASIMVPPMLNVRVTPRANIVVTPMLNIMTTPRANIGVTPMSMIGTPPWATVKVTPRTKEVVTEDTSLTRYRLINQPWQTDVVDDRGSVVIQHMKDTYRRKTPKPVGVQTPKPMYMMTTSRPRRTSMRRQVNMDIPMKMDFTTKSPSIDIMIQNITSTIQKETTELQQAIEAQFQSTPSMLGEKIANKVPSKNFVSRRQGEWKI